MFPDWKNWRHVVKLDPDKAADEYMIEQVVASGTDAIIVGGTQNISREKVLRLYKLLKRPKSWKYPLSTLLALALMAI